VRFRVHGSPATTEQPLRVFLESLLPATDVDKARRVGFSRGAEKFQELKIEPLSWGISDSNITVEEPLPQSSRCSDLEACDMSHVARELCPRLLKGILRKLVQLSAQQRLKPRPASYCQSNGANPSTELEDRLTKK